MGAARGAAGLMVRGLRGGDLAGGDCSAGQRLVSGQGSSNELAGPVAIAQMAGQSAKNGFESLFTFMALLSMNLAVLNLLPIPMLDGGHLFIMGIEAITRRNLSVKQKEVLQQIGFVFLLALMIYVTANDIGRWLTN